MVKVKGNTASQTFGLPPPSPFILHHRHNCPCSSPLSLFPPISDHFPLPSLFVPFFLPTVVHPSGRPSVLPSTNLMVDDDSSSVRVPPPLPFRWGHTLNVRAMSEVDQNAHVARELDYLSEPGLPNEEGSQHGSCVIVRSGLDVKIEAHFIPSNLAITMK